MASLSAQLDMLKSQVKDILGTIEDIQNGLDKTARSALSVSFPTTPSPAPVPVSVLGRDIASRISHTSFLSARPPQGSDSHPSSQAYQGQAQSKVSVSSETTTADWADAASRSSRVRY